MTRFGRFKDGSLNVVMRFDKHTQLGVRFFEIIVHNQSVEIAIDFTITVFGCGSQQTALDVLFGFRTSFTKTKFLSMEKKLIKCVSDLSIFCWICAVTYYQNIDSGWLDKNVDRIEIGFLQVFDSFNVNIENTNLVLILNITYRFFAVQTPNQAEI